ncbi:MAG: RluA family pseudouridine synthase [Ktedonobacterales bacterium]
MTTHLAPAPPSVLYEDIDLLIINKPAGLVVHPAYKHPDNTLVDAIAARQARRGEQRPWLLHRLDRVTSGVVIFAKTETARRALVRQFERRSIRKRYLAIVSGRLEPASGSIDASLQRDPDDRRRTIITDKGKPAETWYQVLAQRGIYALVLAEPRTGRTHQIRAHLASRGAPLAGDICYDDKHEPGISGMGAVPRVMLHAWQLSAIHPATGLLFQISAPLPPDMNRCIRDLQLAAGFRQIPTILHT